MRITIIIWETKKPFNYAHVGAACIILCYVFDYIVYSWIFCKNILPFKETNFRSYVQTWNLFSGNLDHMCKLEIFLVYFSVLTLTCIMCYCSFSHSHICVKRLLFCHRQNYGSLKVCGLKISYAVLGLLNYMSYSFSLLSKNIVIQVRFTKFILQIPRN